MNIPKPETVERILHRGVERIVVIREVRPELGNMWRVSVQANDNVFANGDEVFWLDAPARDFPRSSVTWSA